MKKIEGDRAEACRAKASSAQPSKGRKVKTKEGMRPAVLPFTIEVLDETSAALTIGNQKYKLSLGKWSPIIELKFRRGLP